MNHKLSLLVALVACGITPLPAEVTVVERPVTTSVNRNYVGNRSPLQPSALIALPIGAVQPAGWLAEMLRRQRDGLCGHLGEISAWLQKDGNAWLSTDGQGRYGWEEVPYWLRGYLEMAWLFHDPKMIAESQVWIEGALQSQRANGDFGPDQKFKDGTRDFWANMLMLHCLEAYYERTNDERVLNLMTKYFQYHASLPDGQLLTHYWQKMRGGDELQAILWLYNRTGDSALLATAEKIHGRTANWERKDSLPDWHNVNIAEAFREPATYSLLSHSAADLQATYADFAEVRKRYGQVPGGMFGGDENCRPGYADPRQAIETCGMVEQMLSDELLLPMTGDPLWADNCEDVAFNSYPAALTPDLRALRYLTAPNMVVSDARNHSPGIDNRGPFLEMNPFSSRCCQHNHSMGWPSFSKHLWLATPDNGLCAALYSASTVTAKVGDGSEVRIEESTRYPFEETIRLTVHAEKPATFPLYLRIPGWCQAARVSVNGREVLAAPAADHYVRIEREWSDGETVGLVLPMTVTVRRWTANHDSVSVALGPLTYSLQFAEKVTPADSTAATIGDSHWQKNADPKKWPAFDYYAASPWNYGLIVDEASPARSFTVERKPWPADNYPFTQAAAPIAIKARVKRIPQWQLDQNGLCAVLQQSPVKSEEPVEEATLIPMGATRLRISAFPTIGDGPTAHEWLPPASR